MSVRFAANFREKEGDKDHFARSIRVLRAAYSAITLGALWLMFQAVWFGEFRGQSFEKPLNGPLCFAIIMFILSGFSKRDPELSEAVQRSRYLSVFVVFALVAAEATRLFDWWNPEAMIGWWRLALLVTAGAFVLYWAAEKAIRILQSRRESS